MLPWDPESLVYQSDQSVQLVLVLPFHLLVQRHPAFLVCLRVQEDLRIPGDRVVPVLQVPLVLPVTFQECYVVTAFFRREPSTRVSLGTRRFVPQAEGTGKEQRRKLSVVNNTKRQTEEVKERGGEKADKEKERERETRYIRRWKRIVDRDKEKAA